MTIKESEVDKVAEPPDLCTICDRPMSNPTMVNAIFGAHPDCMDTIYPSAVSAADEICALSEALTGKNAHVAAIIANHFGRAHVTSQAVPIVKELALVREAILSVIDRGWNCHVTCDLKHAWQFNPNEESDKETKERMKFVDAVQKRILELSRGETP